MDNGVIQRWLHIVPPSTPKDMSFTRQITRWKLRVRFYFSPTLSLLLFHRQRRHSKGPFTQGDFPGWWIVLQLPGVLLLMLFNGSDDTGGDWGQGDWFHRLTWGPQLIGTRQDTTTTFGRRELANSGGWGFLEDFPCFHFREPTLLRKGLDLHHSPVDLIVFF